MSEFIYKNTSYALSNAYSISCDLSYLAQCCSLELYLRVLLHQLRLQNAFSFDAVEFSACRYEHKLRNTVRHSSIICGHYTVKLSQQVSHQSGSLRIKSAEFATAQAFSA